MLGDFSDKKAIGKHLRQLSALIDKEAKQVYAARGIQFEQRWFGFLNQLVINGPMTVKAISEALGITHVSVSETRKSLHASGLIQSTASETDGRQKLINLSPEGIKLTETLSPIWAALSKSSEELNAEAGDVSAALERLDLALKRKSLIARTLGKLD